MYKLSLPELKAGEKISLVISTAYVDSLTPYPRIVSQDGKQYLLYQGEKYAPTLYTTLKQKTKIKYLPNNNTPNGLDDVDVDCAERLRLILMAKRIRMDKLILRNQAVC